MYDPTEPGHIPVYNLHNIPASPPPPHKKRSHKIFITAVIALLLAIGGSVVGMVYAEQHSNTNVHADRIVNAPVSKATPTHRVLQATPTPTPTYTAADIFRDFQNDPHLHLMYVSSGMSISAWDADYTVPIKSQSSVSWGDITGCTGGCTPGNVGLWVYATTSDAIAAYMYIESTTPVNGGGYLGILVANVHGRCLLLGTEALSEYVPIMLDKCT